MKTFLHVGCGPKRKDRTTSGFADWNELRFDINEFVQPDLVGTMTDMSSVSTESVDAVFSSHNIEHLYPHEVPVALSEFLRVLKPDGFALITCPRQHNSFQSLLDQIGQNIFIDVKTKLVPVRKASGCAIFVLKIAAYVEKGFDMFFREKTPPPCEQWGSVRLFIEYCEWLIKQLL